MILSTDGSGSVTAQLIIIVVLILINAVLAASELAILSSSSYKIDALAKEGNKRAKLVKKLKEDETKFLSTIQVGITLAGFFSSATAAVTLSKGLGQALIDLNIPFGDDIALVLVTLILSYFTLVFGELFPKRLALRAPEKVAMAFCGPINVIKVIFKPIVALLSGSCELLVKIFRLKNNDNDKVTEEEIKAIISTGVEDGAIDEEEQELINAVFSFGNLKVRDVMTPRINTVMININYDIKKINKIIKEEQFTRIPVYEEDKDNVIGILNIKDILLFLPPRYSANDLRNILRKPLFVLESMKVDTLFKKMQDSKDHSAIVIDEMGAVSGYVTLEDLVEEIMGEIDDEYDESKVLVRKTEDNTYIIDSNITFSELAEELDIQLDCENEPYVNLAGYMICKLERLPEIGDEVELPEYNKVLVVKEVINNSIKEIELKDK